MPYRYYRIIRWRLEYELLWSIYYIDAKFRYKHTRLFLLSSCCLIGRRSLAAAIVLLRLLPPTLRLHLDPRPLRSPMSFKHQRILRNRSLILCSHLRLTSLA